MDELEYLARREARRDANRLLLGMLSFMFFIGSLGCFAAAWQKTETKSSGHLWWRDESTIAIPTETRLAWLLAAVLLMTVAFSLALITYRVARGIAANDSGYQQPVMSGIGGSSSHVTYGHSKEFWVQTTIAVLGLIITAASAATAWWA